MNQQISTLKKAPQKAPQKALPRLPFLLAIVDRDTRRVTIEGPMTDDWPWRQEIVRAQQAGRQISCRILVSEPNKIPPIWEEACGCMVWPPGSIISLTDMP